MFGARFCGEEMGVWEGRTVWNMTRPLPWSVWGGLIKGMVPSPFSTDLASVPRDPMAYGLFGGRCNREGATHDDLYRSDGVVEVWTGKLVKEVPDEVVAWVKKVGTGTHGSPPRHIGDHILKQLMIEEGEPEIVHEPIFLAVRVGGAGSYHRFKRGDILPCDKWVKVVEI